MTEIRVGEAGSVFVATMGLAAVHGGVGRAVMRGG